MQKKEHKFTKIRKDAQGRLVEFQTEDGKVYDYEMALEAIEKGHISNAEIITNRSNSKVIKGKNNQALDDLPEF